MVLPIFLTSCNTLLVCFFILSDMPLMVASIYQVVIFSCCRLLSFRLLQCRRLLSSGSFSSFVLSSCHHVVTSFSRLVTMKLCRFFIVFRFQPVILSSCRKITLSSSDYDIFITLSSCHLVILS